MKAVLSVIGKDQVGILALVSTECSKYNVNIIDVSQTVMQDTFAMIMMVELDKMSIKLDEFQDVMQKCGEERGLQIHVMHEDIFNSMHRI
jgi:ACT domain-containing protein